MLVFSAFGPSEYVLLCCFVLSTAIGFFFLSKILRLFRKVDECHAMLMELVHRGRERGV